MDWEPERDEHSNIIGLEIGYFDEDPDGEEDRAGDGYYYRIAGDSDWSGAWHSEEEAEEEAIEELGDRRDSAAYVLAIHRRTGWPLAGVWGGEMAVGIDPGEAAVPTKLFCMTPDGHAMDATGTYYPSYLTRHVVGARAVTYATESEWRSAVSRVSSASYLAPSDEEVAEVEDRIAGNAALLERLSGLGRIVIEEGSLKP